MANYQIPSWVIFSIFAVLASQYFSGSHSASILNSIAIAALLAGSLRFVMLIGELNFAIAAFVGIGAYSAGVATTMLDISFFLAILTSGVAASLISMVFGSITLRSGGPYFLLIGFAFTEAMRIVYSKTDVLGQTSGMVGIFPPIEFDDWLSLFVIIICLGLLFLMYVIEKSQFGTIFKSIRDNSDVTRTVGINVLYWKVVCFAIASFCAGIAGALQAFVNNVISPGDFGYLLAVFALAYVKVGGESSIAGSILGAIFLVVLSEFALALGAGEHIFYGAAIVIAVLFMREGIVGLVSSTISWITKTRASKEERV
jgi:branched-chain amino acid transport system permease protein